MSFWPILLMVCNFSLLANISYSKTYKFRDMAVVGDSFSTGALASEQLSLEPDRLWGILLGDEKLTIRQTESVLLPYSSREFANPMSWVMKSFISAVSATYINNEQVSWPSQLASSLGMEEKNLFFAAKNGERAEHAVFQIERLLRFTGGVAPDLLLILFSGNDFCTRLQSLMTRPEDYGQSIGAALEFFFRNAKPKISDGVVILPALLNLVQLVSSSQIKTKVVKAFGREDTCETLRKRSFKPTKSYSPKYQQALSFLSIFPQTPATYCPALFDSKVGTKDMISFIGTLTKSYRKEVRAVVKELAVDLVRGKYPGFEGWTLKYAPSVEDIAFYSQDIAEDCLHLSEKGHERLAQSIKADVWGL